MTSIRRRTKTGCDGGGECSHEADENDWQAVGPVVGRLRKNRHGNLLPYDKNNKYRTGIGYSTDCVVGSFAVNKQIVLVPFNKHPPPTPLVSRQHKQMRRPLQQKAVCQHTERQRLRQSLKCSSRRKRRLLGSCKQSRRSKTTVRPCRFLNFGLQTCCQTEGGWEVAEVPAR